MGKVIVDVKLTNFKDLNLLEEGYILKEKLRTWKGKALVDTGATLLILPKSVSDKLGLIPYRITKAKLANGKPHDVGIAEGIVVEINKRRALVECAILEEADDVLVGQIPLEYMDWHMDCKNNKLVGRPESPDAPMIDIL